MNLILIIISKGINFLVNNNLKFDKLGNKEKLRSPFPTQLFG